MKVIINENERGFLFKNGTYRKLLMPGKHHVKRCFGETYVRANTAKPVAVANADISVLLKDKNFADSVVCAEVPDGCVALHMEDNRIVGTLYPGKYCFWNCYRKHTFQMLNVSGSEIRDLTQEQLMAVPANLYIRVEVPEGEVGLLFVDGRLERKL